MNRSDIRRVDLAVFAHRWRYMRGIGWFAALALAAAFSAGCSSPEPRYYTLASRLDAATPAKPRLDRPLWIEVMPVSIPEYLNRPQLVLRGSTNDGEIKVMEFVQWSAPLRDELRDALSLHLQTTLGAIDVYKLASARGDPTIRVAAEVVRLDAGLGQQAVASISWTVRNLPDGKVIVGNTNAELPVPATVDGVVAAYRQIVAAAAADIAAAVQSQQRRSTAHGAPISGDTCDAAEANFDRAVSAVEVARATLDVARQNKDDTVVCAPYPGVVTVKATQAGEIISPIFFRVK